MKKTGKALSLVLSLALVVSSIPATFASAAGRSAKTASITIDKKDGITLCNGGTGDQLNSGNIASDFDVKTASFATDHSDLKTAHDANLVLKDVVMANNTIATLAKKDTNSDGTIDEVIINLKNKDVTGTVNLYARYEGAIRIGADEDTTKVYAQATLTAKVVANGSASIEFDKTKMAKTADSVVGKIKVAKPSTGSALVDYDYAELTDAKTVPAGAYQLQLGNADLVKLTTGGESEKTKFTLTNTALGDKYAKTGTVSVVAQRYKNTADANGKFGADNSKGARISAKVTIENTVAAAETDSIISQYSSKTYIGKEAASKGNTAKDATYKVRDITGCNVDLTACTGTVTMQSGKVGNVTVDAKDFEVQDGTVGDITAKAAGSVTIKKGTVGAVDVTSALIVNGGTVKSISDSGNVTIQPDQDKTPVTVGDITATKNLIIDSNDTASVKVGKLTAVTDGSITLTGDKVSVAGINADYRTSALNLTNFKGSITAPSNTYTEGVENDPKFMTLNVQQDADKTTDANITGAASFNTVVMTEGTLTFADTVKIGENGLSGSGTLQFAPGALYTKGDIYGVNVRLTKDFNTGDKIFTADTDVVSEDDFTGVGFTAEKKAANTTTDVFTVKDKSFAGVSIDGPDKIAKGTTATYTAVAYPNGKTLPEGYKVQWTFTGYDEYLKATADANDSTKITIEAVAEDPTFASLNEGTLTATILDADGVEDPTYAPVSKTVSIGSTKKFTSDTSYKDMKVGETYQFKITSADGSQPDFVVASQGATVVANGKSGNDYFYKVTAAKVGTFGIYCGDKVAIIKVTSGISTDTKTVTKKAGETYQFKITVSNGKAPEFKIATVGAVKASSSKGNDFFFKYTVKSSDAKGTHGVYVNGERLASFIFA